MKNNLIILVLFVSLILLLELVPAPLGNSTNFDVFSKYDYGVAGNTSSSSYSQRYISGFEPVSQYSSPSFGGRLGILGLDSSNAIINLSSPLNNAILVRGNESYSGEDDLGIISNTNILTGKIYDQSTQNGIPDQICYFYDNLTLLGSSATNSSGDCTLTFYKSAQSIVDKLIFINYTYGAGPKIINTSQINVSIEKYVMTLTESGLRSNGKYYNGDNASLTITVRKSNSTSTDILYDIGNITADAANSANSLRGAFFYPSNITRTSTGTYEVSINVTYGSGSDAFIKWNIKISDDNSTFIGSALHADIGICQGDFGSWSTCSGGSQSRTDSSGCSETQSCGGGGTSCFPGYTLIDMADGSKKQIKDVKVGEKVLSYDLSAHRLTSATVIELESPMREALYEINGLINVTDEHPFYTKKKNGILGWSSIDKEKGRLDLIGSEIEGEEVYNLEVGDYLFTNKEKWIKVETIKYFPGDIKTYNLKTINKYHKFFANGFLVHNKDGGGSCSNDCSNGETRLSCGGDPQNSILISESCGDYDTDNCLEWGNSTLTNCGLEDSCKIINGNPRCTACSENWICPGWGICYQGDPSDYYGGQSLLSSNINNENILSPTTFSVSSKVLELDNDNLFFDKILMWIRSIFTTTGYQINNIITSKSNCDEEGKKKCSSRINYYEECKKVSVSKGFALRWQSIRIPTGMICEGEGSIVCSDINSCNTESERACISSTQYNVCEKDSNGCLFYSGKKQCNQNFVCIEDGLCACSQINACSLEGQRQCTTTSKYQICSKNQDGCLKWTSDFSCSTGEICNVNAVCEKGSSGETTLCEIGNKTCINNHVYECKNFNDLYNRWELIVRCSGNVCSDGVCMPQGCFNGIQDGDEVGIDCGGSKCILCPILPTFNESQSNQTKNTNDTEEIQPSPIIIPYEIKKIYLTLYNRGYEFSELEFGVQKNFIIKKGDKISVTYEKIENTSAVFKIELLPSTIPTTLTENHSITINKLPNDYLEVIVQSTPQSKPITVGETVIFEFDDLQKIIQTRSCYDSNFCGTDNSRPTDVQLCSEDSIINFCKVDVKCSWTLCKKDDKFTYPYKCRDANSCNIKIEIPGQRLCKDRPIIPEEQICSIENIQCSDWSGECTTKFDLKDIFNARISLEGIQKRFCEDLNQCLASRNEERQCSEGVPIDVKKVMICNKEYVEIYESNTNNLVSRVKQENITETLKRFDVAFIITDSIIYCDYCFDNKKDFDEEGVDCGGEQCPLCTPKHKYFDWLFYLIILSWLTVLLLIVIIFCRSNNDEYGKTLCQRIRERLMNKTSAKTPTHKKHMTQKQLENKIVKGIRSFMKPTPQIMEKPKVIKELIMKPNVTPQIREKQEIIKEIIYKSDKDRLADLKRKLREWRKQGYYGTYRLEHEIKELEEKIKSERKIHKIIRFIKKPRHGHSHVVKSIEKEHKEIIKKENKKQRKKERKIIKKMKRKQKLDDLKRKLKFWKRKGYYGTSKLEEEIKKASKK